MTSKGQITIPVEIRRRLGLNAGDRVEFVCGNDGFVLRPVRSRDPFRKYVGCLAGSLPSSLDEIVRQERLSRGHD